MRFFQLLMVSLLVGGMFVYVKLSYGIGIVAPMKILSLNPSSEKIALSLILKTMNHTSATRNETKTRGEGVLASSNTKEAENTSSKSEAVETGYTFEPLKWRKFGFREDIFVYSAYYRREKKDIMIVGMVKRMKNYSVVCSFPSMPSVKRIKASVNIIPEHHGQKRGAVLIRCVVHMNETDIPNVLELRVGSDRSRLTIQFPRPRQFNFTVCLACLHGPYQNHERLIEMVETDLLLGAQHFVVYNYSTSHLVDKVLQHYTRLGVLEVRPWNLPKLDIHYFGQLVSTQDCILSSRGESKYVVLKDVDEVIVPHQHQNWTQMMSFLDQGHNRASFMFRNTFFETNWTNYNPPKKNTPIIQSLKYIWRDRQVLRAKIRSKVILKPELVEVQGIHFPWKLEKGFINTVVKVSVALLHHYRAFENTKNKSKDTTMLRYSDALESNIKKMYTTLGISFESSPSEM